ncbi:MAG: T9SS type A sorting domain-containing protein [Candidatus Marinimicrobia bacterium]|nr:T9SS type A sorting domain-containing protein [Candidatus Neomarinimicrobiota bacterium]MCF7828391.1 T9SS type A sorting domain-containing protein [Candidatus Neomarinimicrobiota bacterium]MCF7881015.1 T9SS type A sorting domain-containing protein [Candidatus Neomarinimicrobiota bacterium]
MVKVRYLVFLLILFPICTLGDWSVNEVKHLGPISGNTVVPRQITLDTSRNYLFSLSRLNSQVSVIDLDINSVIQTIPFPGFDGLYNPYSSLFYSYFDQVLYIKGTEKIYLVNGIDLALQDSIQLDAGSYSHDGMLYDEINQTLVIARRNRDTASYSFLRYSLETHSMINTIIFPYPDIQRWLKNTFKYGLHDPSTAEYYIYDSIFSDTQKKIYVYNILTNTITDTLYPPQETQHIFYLPELDIFVFSEIEEMGQPGYLRYFDVETKQIVGSTYIQDPTWRNPFWVYYDSYANDIYVSFERQMIQISMDTYEIVQLLRAPGALRIDASNRKIYARDATLSGLHPGTIHSIDLNTFEYTKPIVLGAVPSDMLIIEKTNKLLLSEQSQGRIMQLDGNSVNIEKELKVGFSPRMMALDTTTNYLYVANWEEEVSDEGWFNGWGITVVDLNTWTQIHKIIFEYPKLVHPMDLKVNYNTRELWVVNRSNTNPITIIDLDTWEYVYNVDTGGYPGFIEINQESNIAYQTGHKTYAIRGDDYSIIKEISTFDALNIGINYQTNKMYLNGVCDGLHIVDLNTFTVFKELKLGFWGNCSYQKQKNIYVDEEHNLVFVTKHYGSDKLFVIDGETDEVTEEVPVGYGAWNVQLNPRTMNLYVLNELDGTISVLTNPDYPGYNAPSPPMETEIVPGDNQLSLQWTVVEEATNGYNLYRSRTQGGQYVKINSSAIQDTFYTDLNLTNNEQYYYRVASVGKYYIEGEKSIPQSAIPIELPDFTFRTPANQKTLMVGDTVTYPFDILPESQFVSDITFTVINAPEGISVLCDPNPLKREQTMEMKVWATNTIEPATYEFEVWAQGGGQTHVVALSVVILDEGNITINTDPVNPYVNEALVVFGEINPRFSDHATLHLWNPNGTHHENDVPIDFSGNYLYEFQPAEQGQWKVMTQIAGTTSDTLDVLVTKAPTQVNCTVGVLDSVAGGWQATIKGRIFPPPGITSGAVSIAFQDNSLDSLQVVVNEEGYFGYSYVFPEKGKWSITASWPGNEAFIGAESTPTIVPVGYDVGRAIVIRGSSPEASGERIAAYDSLTQFAYRVLRQRRFTDDLIYLIHPDESFDVDNDGVNADVDTTPSVSAIEHAITEWANPALNDSIGLTLYLLGDVISGRFQLSETEEMTATQLGEWLRTITTRDSTIYMTVIVESSNAWGLYPETLPNTITFISATDTTNNSLGDAGDLSFSRFFWNGIFEGQSIGSAFLTTHDIIIDMPEVFQTQFPQLEHSGNGIPNEETDFTSSQQLFIGGTESLGSFAPSVLGSGVSEGEGGLTKYTSADNRFLTKLSRANDYGIRLWSRFEDETTENLTGKVLLINPTGEHTVHVLEFNAQSGRHEYFQSHFTATGKYTGYLYARDEWGRISTPLRRTFFLADTHLTDINPNRNIPSRFTLRQNYPNPFNGKTTIQYELPEASQVSISIYNIRGQRIYTIHHELQQPGYYTFNWNGTNHRGVKVSSGAYFYRLETGDFVDVKKMVYMK